MENMEVEQDNLASNIEGTSVQANTATPQQAQSPDVEEEHEEHQEEHHDDGKSYVGVSLAELLKESELLLEQESKEADASFKKLKEESDRLFTDAKEEARKRFVAEGGELDGFSFKPSTELATIAQNYSKFQAKKKQQYNDQKKGREDNLTKKKALLETLKHYISSSDEKGVFDKVKALQINWKEVGPVPSTDAESLYSAYKALLDQFYDKKSIEHELKELDRKKNLEAKLELCAKAEALTDSTNLNAAAQQLYKLHEEYKAIGPVPKEEQEKVWERFKVASDTIYDKKRVLSDAYKKQLKDNMEAKRALCLKVEEYVGFQSDRIKEWNSKSKEILELQTEWEKIGALPREVAKDINRQFWTNFKTFFSNKSKFFEQLDSERQANLTLKKGLLEKAIQMQESSDWEGTSNAYIELQNQWKEIGPVPENVRESIYQEFKAACDMFFNSRRNSKNTQDNEFKDNLKRKLDICLTIPKLVTEPDSIAQLKTKIDEFLSIGFVPRKDMDSIIEKFTGAIDAFFEAFKAETEDAKEKIKLEIQVAAYSQIPNAIDRIKRQEQTIRKKIQLLESDIALWDNNMAFFSKSKTANKLMDDFSQKIEHAKSKMSELKGQLKLLKKINY